MKAKQLLEQETRPIRIDVVAKKAEEDTEECKEAMFTYID